MSSSAKAVVAYGPYQNGGWKLQDVTLRPLRDDEVLVEMVASGICHTDLHFAGMESGYGVCYPRIMGHEGWATLRPFLVPLGFPC